MKTTQKYEYLGYNNLMLRQSELEFHQQQLQAISQRSQSAYSYSQSHIDKFKQIQKTLVAAAQVREDEKLEVLKNDNNKFLGQLIQIGETADNRSTYSRASPLRRIKSPYQNYQKETLRKENEMLSKRIMTLLQRFQKEPSPKLKILDALNFTMHGGMISGGQRSTNTSNENRSSVDLNTSSQQPPKPHNALINYHQTNPYQMPANRYKAKPVLKIVDDQPLPIQQYYTTKARYSSLHRLRNQSSSPQNSNKKQIAEFLENQQILDMKHQLIVYYNTNHVQQSNNQYSSIPFAVSASNRFDQMNMSYEQKDQNNKLKMNNIYRFSVDMSCDNSQQSSMKKSSLSPQHVQNMSIQSKLNKNKIQDYDTRDTLDGPNQSQQNYDFSNYNGSSFNDHSFSIKISNEQNNSQMKIKDSSFASSQENSQIIEEDVEHNNQESEKSFLKQKKVNLEENYSQFFPTQN